MLRVLGVVEIDGHGTPRSQAQRTMLAALALDAGVVVSRARLAELIWGDDQPENPDASLQNHVSRARKVLGPGMVIAATGTGYRLDVEADRLDTAVFDRRFRQACSSQPAERLEIVDEALDLWRGRPFDDLDDDRADAEVARLEETMLALRELRAESLLAQDRTLEAIGELERQRQEDPLREKVVELLMRAYVQAGRKTDALAAYQSLRTAMVDELGLDPSPEIRDLEAAILTEDLVADRTDPPPTAPAQTGHVVEVPTSRFFGRGEDLERVEQALDDHRIVTLVGTGGVGKTRLAIHAANALADRFGEGAALIELASVRDPAQLAEAIASGLDLPARAGVTAIERVIDALADRHLLLVLDNCEHLIDDAAAFVERAVRGAPRLHVLATSREPLNVDGERVVRTHPLAVDTTAIDLFADRAAAQADLVIDETSRPLVRRLCEALDGLPLALELAAARCSSMTLEEIAEGLEERFSLLVGGRRSAHERHRSLWALVDWSVRGLDSDLAAVFVPTSVFSGSFTAEAAAAVTKKSGPAVRLALADLVDRSLVVEQLMAGRPTRYRLLETIRAYAAELFDELPEAAEITERHNEWVLGQVEHLPAALTTPDDVRAMDDLTENLSDLRVVHARFLETDDADRSLRLAAGLHFVAFFRMQAEMFQWVMQAADRFGDAEHPMAEDVLASASIGSWQAGDLEGARHFAERAMAVAAHLPYRGAGRAGHEATADVVQFTGDNHAALSHFEQALRLSRLGEDQLRVIVNLADLSMIAGYLGETTRADAAITEASQLVAGCGSISLGAWTAFAEGEAFAETDPERAIDALGRALELAHQTSAQFIVGVAGLTHTGLLARGGDPARVVNELVELMEHWRARAASVQQWITLRTVVDLLVRLGDSGEAAIVLGAVLASDEGATGPDAVRLAAAKELLTATRADAQQLFDQGAAMSQRAVVELSIGHLRSLGATPHEP